MFNKLSLRKKYIVYVKDEGSNLNAMTFTLKSIVRCETLGLQKKFIGMYFRLVFSKAC